MAGLGGTAGIGAAPGIGAAGRLARRELTRTAMPSSTARIPATMSQPTADSKAVTRPQSCATVLSKAWPIWPMPESHSAALGAANR